MSRMWRTDKREKLRKINEAKLYQYKAAFNSWLEFMHIGKNLNSACIEEDNESVIDIDFKWFMQWLGANIDELDKNSTGKKNKWHIF